MKESATEPVMSSSVSIASSTRHSSRLRKSRGGSISSSSGKNLKMRPETTITLNKPAFRADEPITGFVDIDTKLHETDVWDSKLWVVKLRLVGYAQMDTQWEDQARNPYGQEKLRFETLPIEDVEVTIKSSEVPFTAKPASSNGTRSLPFQIQLSPAQLISSYNAQRGLFLVDYLLTATTRKKCPSTGWNLMKLETRTFVSITPPQAEIERPLQVTPYSPPLDEMDLFRCPFMQTIRFNYSNRLTPSTLSPSHRMSIYFPKPLYQPEEVSISLTSTLTLRYNEFCNRNTESKELDYEVFYRADTGGEEARIEYDVPVKIPQTMGFAFTKGVMSMSHCLRVNMKVRLFPDDRNKASIKLWSIDLPVTVKGQHYISLPGSPSGSLSGSPTIQYSGGRSSSESQKASGTTSASWFRDGPRLSSESTDGTAPLSAASATSSFATTASEITERESWESTSPRQSADSPNRHRALRIVNRDSVPPQKPVPKGPIPVPPKTKSPSPVLVARQLAETTRVVVGDKPLSQRALEKQPEGSIRGRDISRSPTQNRSRSVPAQGNFKAEFSMHDPFLPPVPRGVTSPEPYREPLSATSISTKSTVPGTPTTGVEVPLYYSSKPTYMIDIKPPAKAHNRPRANTGGSSKGQLTPISPSTPVLSPSTPSTSKVKFNPKVERSPSPPPLSPVQPAIYRVKSPVPQSPLMSGFPWRAISPPPREGSATPTSMKSAPPSTMNSRIPTSPKLSASLSKKPSITSAGKVTASSAPAKYTGATTSRIPSSPTSASASTSARGNTTAAPPAQYSKTMLPKINTSVASQPKQASPKSPLSPSVKPGVQPIQNGDTKSSRKISPPPPKVGPTPRPPLPSQGRERITSFATEATTSTHTSAPSVSTKATSVSEGGSPKVQLKRRPTNPSLFPPLPPATLAVQKKQFEGRERVGSPEPVGADGSASHLITVSKDGRIWI